MSAIDPLPDVTIEQLPERLRAAVARGGWAAHLEKMDLDRIAKRFGIDLQARPMPTPADVEAVVAERVTALLEARLRQRDKLLIERSQRFVPLGRSRAENEDESAIIAMLLDDYYQQTLHTPMPQPGGAPAPTKQGRSRVARRRR
jgi:ATP-dependent RNA helicase DeaD